MLSLPTQQQPKICLVSPLGETSPLLVVPFRSLQQRVHPSRRGLSWTSGNRGQALVGLDPGQNALTPEHLGMCSVAMGVSHINEIQKYGSTTLG